MMQGQAFLFSGSPFQFDHFSIECAIVQCKGISLLGDRRVQLYQTVIGTVFPDWIISDMAMTIFNWKAN